MTKTEPSCDYCMVVSETAMSGREYFKPMLDVLDDEECTAGVTYIGVAKDIGERYLLYTVVTENGHSQFLDTTIANCPMCGRFLKGGTCND